MLSISTIEQETSFMQFFLHGIMVGIGQYFLTSKHNWLVFFLLKARSHYSVRILHGAIQPIECVLFAY